MTDTSRALTMELVLDTAINRGLIDGGVVTVGNSSGILYSTSRGSLFSGPSAPPLDEHTAFDVASLTKVVATAPAVLKLLESGRISLTDPITRWFPELEGTGREDVTILNLLTHTSGLHDVSLPTQTPLVSALQKLAKQISTTDSGSRFRYADINFILLGELVRRVTGQPFDRFCSETIYAPLGMQDTGFLPNDRPARLALAPTYGSGGETLVGAVQDENSRNMGGIAGHAGLFSTASDLARFAMMIMNGGSGDSGRIYDARSISQMTAPYFFSNGSVIRGLGWDIHSPFSSPRGNAFSDMSFGHTGYSGSSLWIDPHRDLFVILLTIRRDYHDTRQFNRLRSTISDIAVSSTDPTGIPPLQELYAVSEQPITLTH